MSNCDNKEEVRVRGVEYSVYCEIDVDLINNADVSCPLCGTENTMSPVTGIEIFEVFDAHTMIEKNFSPALWDSLKKAIKKDYVFWHSLCDSCLDQMIETHQR